MKNILNLLSAEFAERVVKVKILANDTMCKSEFTCSPRR